MVEVFYGGVYGTRGWIRGLKILCGGVEAAFFDCLCFFGGDGLGMCGI